MYHELHCDQTNQQCVGFTKLRAALFRDYNSGVYTLAYQGTNFSAIDDWIINLAQSLGGGYASAGVLASGIHADTFNASGLLRETIVGHTSRTRFSTAHKFVTTYQAYTSKPGRFGDDPSSTFGDVPDILSYMQRNISGTIMIPYINHSFEAMPQAVGLLWNDARRSF